MPYRIGTGFDVHRLAEGETLNLGGVVIPSPFGTLGHSDADVLIHAICDAMLGALGLGDLGQHFPDTDMRWKDADSRQLLVYVMEWVRGKGYEVVNIDSTLALQAPRISPYITMMRQAIAETIDAEPSQVSIKATTTEGMGYEGRGEGVSAQAVVLLRRV
ncbi:MAG: 2-C-methyl-D-erythritol 2,4-cyclodiphosphate synthase [Bacteroidales bacterium]|nr:2-C-methyl-D-erythritol 2,4-cyclodiphosphate synthase [Bacteroidales bacterium]